MAATSRGQYGIRVRRTHAIVAMAVFMASVMLISPFNVGDSEAETSRPSAYIPEPKPYLYELTTDETGTGILSVRVTEEEGGVLQDRRAVLWGDAERDIEMGAINASKINEVWPFDPVTGMGPFNCFYAAFNIDTTSSYTDHGERKINHNAGCLAFILDPFDLGKTLSGTSITKSNYNVFLVIPTVYWKTEGTTLYMSSSPSFTHSGGTVSGMVAYGHIAYNSSYTGSDHYQFDTSLDGVDLLPYMGIGVYQAKVVSDKLCSYSSGNGGTAHKTIGKFREHANNLSAPNGSDFQILNYFQWTLYKMMTYTILGTKNVKYALGTGNEISSTSTFEVYNNGVGDTRGPIAGSQFSGSNSNTKLLIENMWGSYISFFIGDTFYSNGNFYAGNHLGGSGLGTSRQSIVCTVPKTSGYASTAYTDPLAWDLPATVSSGPSRGDPDRSDAHIVGSSNTDRVVKIQTTGNGQGPTSLILSNSFGNYGTGTATRLSYYISSAAMQPEPEFTVTYDSNIPSGPSIRFLAAAGDVVSMPQCEYTNPGFTFVGWNTESDGSGTSYEPGDQVVILANRTFYACWVPNGNAQVNYHSTVPWTELRASVGGVPLESGAEAPIGKYVRFVYTSALTTAALPGADPSPESRGKMPAQNGGYGEWYPQGDGTWRMDALLRGPMDLKITSEADYAILDVSEPAFGEISSGDRALGGHRLYLPLDRAYTIPLKYTGPFDVEFVWIVDGQERGSQKSLQIDVRADCHVSVSETKVAEEDDDDIFRLLAANAQRPHPEDRLTIHAVAIAVAAVAVLTCIVAVGRR